MKKLLIVLASFLFIAGFISMAWAHGPNGSGPGFRGHSFSKPHFRGLSHPRTHLRHNQHFRHKSHNRHFSHKSRNQRFQHKSFNRNFRHKSRNQRFQHKSFNRNPRYYWNYWRFYGPYTGSYGDSYENRPPLEGSAQVPQHSSSSRIYYNNNPEPWFLYGKGKEFREMGLIPPTSNASGN